MSLNGLDDEVIAQALQNVSTEAGGWFLLRYASRDTVALLNGGTGGVSEARRAIQGYEEKSPLYGLVHYRRKRFILKYVPEGTSRLLQVRLAVQFQSVLDTFSHDTVFPFTNADELSESALRLSTMSHSSGSKTPSQTSLRLNEIAEDNEEGPSMKEEPIQSSVVPQLEKQRDDPGITDGLPASTIRAKAMLAKRRQESMQSETKVDAWQIGQEPSASAEETVVAPSPEAPPKSTKEQFPPRSSSIIIDKDLPVPPAEKISTGLPKGGTDTYPEYLHDVVIPSFDSDSDDDARRPVPKEYNPIRYSNHLSAAESTNISQWTNNVAASTSSKHDRALRPHPESQRRPRTAGYSEDMVSVRRVANLPTSVRVSSRISSQPSRPGSQQSTRSVPARFVPSANLPPPLPSPTEPTIPVSRPTASRMQSQTSTLSAESSNVSPEKMRLMKALQMRKRNQLLAQRSAPATALVPPSTMASTDSTQSGLSDLSTAASSTNNASRMANSQIPEIASIDESETTSPISVITISDHHSTDATSLEMSIIVNKSRASLSSDTNSSTTPTANDGRQQRADPCTNQETSIDDTNTSNSASHGPVIVSGPDESSAAKSDRITTINHPEFNQHERQDLASVQSLESQPMSDSVSANQPNKKRHQFEGRITIPGALTDPSEVSDSESFMEELQNATVQEATSMSVNRAPMTPVLSRIPTRDMSRDRTYSDMSNTKHRSHSYGSQASTPEKPRATSRAGSTRSVSTALPQWPPQSTEPVPALPKQKAQISAGISTRVKTFEGLSHPDSDACSVAAEKDHTRGTMLSGMLKRASFLNYSSRTDRTPDKEVPSPSPSPRTAVLEEAIAKANARPVVQRPGAGTEVYSPTHKGETVSITARIVRNPSNGPQGPGDDAQMHWSPLIVQHETREEHDLPSPLSHDTTHSSDSFAPSTTSERRHFSFSSHRANSRNLSPVEKRSQRPSITSSPKKQSRPPSDTSSITEERRASRTSRVLKRLSGFGKPRTKASGITSPTQESLHTETIQEQAEMPEHKTRSVVDIGEVNVQFPEGLLWKRRFLRVDNQGYLIFAPPINDFSTHGKNREIHLDELYQPALPDLEREEMAWSIILDLKAGGTVQCACGSKEAQMSILDMLLNAHSAYNQLYAG
ncbi:hypothetical protein LTR64_002729 [Lithohypha guttulata]|uniref:uncharacterized protein n=1 Tax=Lithohypha guttulata TaxID=1690604 RepID=UPI002DDEE62D|nr:hypothetical protein LTR51_001046 [Lithohypha guttulata]